MHAEVENTLQAPAMPAKVRQCYAHGLAFVGTALRGQVPDFCQNPRNMCENTYHLMISIATQQIHVTRITPITSARAVWFGDRTLKPFVSVLLVFLPKGVPCSDGTQIQPNCHWFPGSFVSILSWCLPSSCCMIKDYSSVSVGFYCMPLASNLRKQAGGNPGHSALVISLVFDVWVFANGVLQKGFQTVMPGQRIIHTVLQFTQSERVPSRSCRYNGHSTYLNTTFVTPFVTSTGLHFQFTCLLHFIFFNL